jgi:hypothetical protein
MLLLNASAWAATPAELDLLVKQVLEQEGALFVTYNVSESGKVSVLFGKNEPDWRVQSTVKALQSHPDIAPAFFWARIDSEFCAIR